MTSVDEIISAIDEGASLLEQANARFAGTVQQGEALSSALLGMGAEGKSKQAQIVTSKLNEIGASITNTTDLAGQARKEAVAIREVLTTAIAPPTATEERPRHAATSSSSDREHHPTAGTDSARSAPHLPLSRGKFDYLFGRVKSNSHNQDRSSQMRRQFARVGIYDNPEGRQILNAHFSEVSSRSDNIQRTFTNEHGTFEIRDSLFCGPGGFLHFESTWQVTGDKPRLTTVIPRGGKR